MSTPTSRFRSWPRWVKFALEMNARLPSTATHLACRLHQRWAWLQGAQVVVLARIRGAERPVLGEEITQVTFEVAVPFGSLLDLRDVYEKAGVDPVSTHGVVQWRENLRRVIEALACEDHALARLLEEAAKHDRRIARGTCRGFRAGPDELGRRSSIFALGEAHVEDGETSSRLVTCERALDRLELVTNAEAD